MKAKAKCPSPKKFKRKGQEKERELLQRVTAGWGKFHRKRKLRSSKGREGPLCTKFPSLKDNLIEAFRIRGGTFHL